MPRTATRTQEAPHIMTPLPGPKAAELIARDAKVVSPSYTRFYPLVAARGSGCVIEDVDGNRFLDFTAGIAVAATGHCHPNVVAAIQDQAERLLHMSGTDFYYRPQIELAERLASLAPGGKGDSEARRDRLQAVPRDPLKRVATNATGPIADSWKVFFCNSGAEAVEAALKLARYHTGRQRVLGFEGAFHGRTYGALSLGASKAIHRAGFGPLLPGVHHMPFGCAPEEIEEHVFRRIAPATEFAAVFVEPILGEGGYYLAPPGFLQGLRELCDRYGILLVADEVQTGMGRTGRMFAVEHFDVVPDVICLAKGIASGMPLGAMLARAELMDWPPGSHASTFGGNPVSCRAALATIDLLESQYLSNARERGRELHEGLRELACGQETLENPRGLGLMQALDVAVGSVRQGRGGAGASWRDAVMRRRNELVLAAFHKGLLLLGCGERGIRFCPPLCATAEDVRTALTLFEEVLDEA